MNIIAATGHRPSKLGGYSPVVLSRLSDLATAYFSRTSPTQIISGMALGWDTASAIAAIHLNIPLIAAVPFEGQERNWQSLDQERYHDILKSATQVVVVDKCSNFKYIVPGTTTGAYHAAKMSKRNEWMVDNCVGGSLVGRPRLIALHDGSNGGTANCVNYANSRKVLIVNLWKSWVKYRGF